MPIPKPRKNEPKKEFIKRCMGSPTMKKEFPSNDQRNAVCYKSWEETKGEKDEN